MKLLLTGRHSWAGYGISRVFDIWGRYFSTATSSSGPVDSLLLRISRSGHPTSSMATILDQWLEQGRHVKYSELQRFIRQLRKYRRFTHALQVFFLIFCLLKYMFSCKLFTEIDSKLKPIFQNLTLRVTWAGDFVYLIYLFIMFICNSRGLC